ncbi:hypothetical protein G9F71_010380 [Clostridium sp. FP2]|nr:hypothetical protein [Clostridium sp. FP2]MBZ9623260.1 hypothetical protein [Clostridium sp. FP2]
MMISIKDEKIKVEYDGNSYDFRVVEFNRRPREVMGRIFNIGRGIPN